MDWTGIAESLTEDDILDLVGSLQAITLKNGKKPFLVEQRGKAYIDIRLLNPTWTAVLMYHREVVPQKSLLFAWGVVDENGNRLSRHAAMELIEKTSREVLVRGEQVIGHLEVEDHGETGEVFGVFEK